MLTIEQLYALYEIMDTEGSGFGGRPRKKGNAYADLKNLIETYRAEPPRHAMLRFASDALYTLVEQMEQAKAQGLNKDQFQKAVKTQMQKFNRAYTNIPDDMLEEEGAELKKTLDEMDSALEMAKSNRETVKKTDDLPPLNINAELDRAAQKNDIQKKASKPVQITIEQLYDIFLNKDNKEELDQEGKPKNRAYAAMKAQAESYNLPSGSMELSFAGDALLQLVSKMEQSNKNISKKAFATTMNMPLKTFNLAYSAIPENVLQNEGAGLNNFMVEMDGAHRAKETAYVKEMKAMINNLTRLAGAVDKLRKGIDIAENRTVSIGFRKDDEKAIGSEVYELDQQEKEELFEVNLDAMKQQVAALMAMDELKRTDGVYAAMDPEKVDELAAHMRDTQAFNDIIDRMDISTLSRDDLAGAFFRAGYTGVTEIFDQSVKKKSEQPVKKNEEQPAKKKEEQPVRDFAKNNTMGVFTKTMENLQKSVAEAKGRILSDEDRKKVAGSLLDAIALRELAQKDTRKPLSADEIKKQKEDILNRDNKQFSAYRAVLKKMEKSPTAMVRIVEGLDDKLSLREFKDKLVQDAGIQLKEKVNTVTVEKGANSPAKKQG